MRISIVLHFHAQHWKKEKKDHWYKKDVKSKSSLCLCELWKACCKCVLPQSFAPLGCNIYIQFYCFGLGKGGDMPLAVMVMKLLISWLHLSLSLCKFTVIRMQLGNQLISHNTLLIINLNVQLNQKLQGLSSFFLLFCILTLHAHSWNVLKW